MKLLKALNNNVALVINENNVEEVIMGSGVAFNKKPGMEVDKSRIEKKYVLEDKKRKSTFNDLLKRIQPDDIELASKIIKMGEAQLGYQCNDSILITLSDHLGMMLQRVRSNIYLETPLHWDIKLIYPKEFAFSKQVIKALNTKLQITIPEQEAAFIALHFINANQENHNMQETMLFTKIIQNILSIVKLHYGKEFDEESFAVSRFITHIRYFVQRQIYKKEYTNDYELMDIIFKRYDIDYRCALKIEKFLTTKYGWDINQSEILFLTLHLNRMNITK